jgi:ATP adenylyltransferase
VPPTVFENLWAGWRSEYIEGTSQPSTDGCVFCALINSDEPDDTTFVLWRGPHTAALLNAYPYTSGHLMVLPRQHIGDLEGLSAEVTTELWATVTNAVRALKVAYRPQGLNVGMNLGHAAGAGLPGHLHVHALPRWVGDTNFMTSIAETRVMPEALQVTWKKLRDAWPA